MRLFALILCCTILALASSTDARKERLFDLARRAAHVARAPAAVKQPVKSPAIRAKAPAPAVKPKTPAKAPATSPATASASFAYGKTTVRGVNIGGWLLLEPWMTPSLFNRPDVRGALDEYSLSKNLGRAAATSVLTQHWSTFINETDFQLIASYGLNHVRIPFGYWMYDINAGEPYVQGQLPFLQQAVKWAAKYGLKVMLDLHGAPGSQNGFDNSGQANVMNWHKDPKNIARTKAIISKLVAEFANPVYGGAVTAIQLLNEPASFKDQSVVPVYQKYLNDGYKLIRNPNGSKTPSSFIVAFHDAFTGLKQWANFWPRAKFPNTLIDTHPYTVFSSAQLLLTIDERVAYICRQKSNYANSKKLYTTVAGEWSAAVTDCAGHLLGQTVGARYDGTYPESSKIGSCTGKSGSAATFSKAYIAELRRYWEVQARMYGENGDGWMMWSWKTEAGAAEDWSYMKGVEYGYIPSDARTFIYGNPCSSK